MKTVVAEISIFVESGLTSRLFTNFTSVNFVLEHFTEIPSLRHERHISLTTGLDQ